ncbi:MAG: AI-2E family transporter [Anaerolineae bacterium]|nr:MAG: AI-2E family transporter [Anaerolineae bacterium]
MSKQVILFATAVMVTFLAVLALWQFRIVLAVVLVSLALAASLRPLVRGWSRRSLVARLGLLVVYIICLVAFGYSLFLTGRLAVGEIQEFSGTLSVQGSWNLPQWLSGTPFQKTVATWLPTPDALFESITGDEGQLVLPAIFNFTQGVGQTLSGALVVLLLSIYWSVNQIHFERLWLSLLPSAMRKNVRSTWRAIESALGAYIRSEAIQSLLAVLLLGVGYWLLGSPYPVVLALIAALAWLIPVVGAGLAILPVLFIGLLTSAQLSLVSVLYTVAVLLALQVWVEPLFLKNKWNNPILTLTLFLVMSDAVGLYGILVAPPLSIVIQILWHRLVSHPAFLGAAEQVSDLKLRLTNLADKIQGMGELPPPLVASSMERLTELIANAAPILQAAQPAAPAELYHPSMPVADELASPLSEKST